MNYHTLLTLLDNHFGYRAIHAGDKELVQQILPHDTIIALLHEIVSNDALLTTIAQRSYTHALGFDKIVLMDLSKDVPSPRQKTQLRFHIWNPAHDALPIVESLHEHSFDFISTILKGRLENQMFLTRPLSPFEHDVLGRLQTAITRLTPSQRVPLNDLIEQLEIDGLRLIGSRQYLEKSYDIVNVRDAIRTLTGLSEQDIAVLPRLQGHYVSNRIAGERASYKHVLKEYVSLTPYSIFNLKQGDYYFHPHQMPHRLYYDNTTLNATMLITTPVVSNPAGGSLQRPSYVQSNEQSYDKIIMTKDSLREKLGGYLGEN